VCETVPISKVSGKKERESSFVTHRWRNRKDHAAERGSKKPGLFFSNSQFMSGTSSFLQTKIAGNLPLLLKADDAIVDKG